MREIGGKGDDYMVVYYWNGTRDHTGCFGGM